MNVSGKDRDPALSLLLTVYCMCMLTVRAIYSTICRYDHLMISHLLDVDECLTSPCKNGATCVNNDGGYQCQCGAGWTGDQCEKGTLSFKQTLWQNMLYVHAYTFAMHGVGKKKEICHNINCGCPFFTLQGYIV